MTLEQEAKARVRAILKAWMAKPGATQECDLFVPLVEAMLKFRAEGEGKCTSNTS